MIREVIQRGAEGSEILTQPSAKVERIDDEVREIIQDLKDTIADLKENGNFTRGIGLSAVQIGKLVWIAAVEDKEGNEYTLINPHVADHAEKTEPIREGCISFLDVRGNVQRFPSVTVEALDEQGTQLSLTTDDPDFAMLLQHEIDHQAGILYVDHLPGGAAELYEPRQS